MLEIICVLPESLVKATFAKAALPYGEQRDN